MIFWILGIVAAFVIGIFTGFRAFLSSFSRQLKKADSPLRRTVDTHLDLKNKDNVEFFAQGAELYHSKRQCPHGCGIEIAHMFRSTQKLNLP